MTGAATQGDRTALWLPLLRTLTAELDDWCVWKNAESAFTGTGDIDAAAPDRTWPTITAAFTTWARDLRIGPVIVCRHIPGGLNLVAVPDNLPTLLEMGTKARRVFRGGTLFVFDDLRPLLVMDPRGFRRIRPGAEGLFKLALNGLRWDGRPNLEALRAKRVRELLVEDPEGAAAAAQIFGRGGPAALAGARAAAAGGWDHRAMLRFQNWALGRALAGPGVLARRVVFRLATRDACPVVRVLQRDARRIPPARDAWLAAVTRDHEVIR